MVSNHSHSLEEKSSESVKKDKKIKTFLGKLNSDEPEDIKSNAKILAEVIRSFSKSFSVPIKEVLRIIMEKGDTVNLKEVRNILFEKYT